MARSNRGRSLRGRIFVLCAGLVGACALVFAMVGFAGLSRLSGLDRAIGASRTALIQESSGETMNEVIGEGLTRTVALAAEISDRQFWSMTHDVLVLAGQAEDVLAHPSRYAEVEVAPPARENGGELVLQLLMPESAPPDEASLSLARKLANLGSMMEEMMRDDAYPLDYYIGLPSGLCLQMDDLSDRKVDGEGRAKAYDPRERDWWIGAVKGGGLYISPAVHSKLLDLEDVEFGCPVYVGGELAAVVEGSVRLETLREFVSQVTFGETGFSVIVDDAGRLIYSPFSEGPLGMDPASGGDLRDSADPGLRALMDTALGGNGGYGEAQIGGVGYRFAFAKMPTVDWTQLLLIESAELLAPTEELLSRMDAVRLESEEAYAGMRRRTLFFLLLSIAALFALALLAALRVSGRIAGPIVRMTDRVGALTGDDLSFAVEESYRTGDEIEVLADAFASLTERTRGYIRELVRVTAERERIGAELDVAARIQAAMLPGDFPLFPDRREFELYATMSPAREVGGDFYDAFLIDRDHLCLVIADVSDKGVPAALFMVVSQTLIRGRAQMGGSPGEILTDVNARLYDGNRERMFVTVWLGILTLSTGELAEANAGHERPAIGRGQGEYELVDRKHGLVLGVRRRMVYREDILTLAPGDRLFLYTDGLPEAVSPQGNRLGLERMLQVLDRHGGDGPEALIGHVRQEVEAFAGEAPQADDLTMLAVIYHGNEGNQRGEEEA